MVSKTEIKKEGWKPRKEKGKYDLKIHRRHVILTLEDDEKVSITEALPLEMDKANPLTGALYLFYGHIPKRYELRIIMRCLGIG